MEDKYYLNQCFNLAAKGKGWVSPNPLVGAVIVKNGKIIGQSWHKKLGEAHAEVNAINSSSEDVAGATLYCNLEPCCHTNKKTPPCVPLIIQKKIKRVVISNIDPNKNVNGKGVEQLRNAGLEVITGILEEEGKSLNKFYFKFVDKKLPYITLKIAQSIDGKIALNRNKQIWLTGTESKKYVHKLRSKYDAVLVGAGTIKTDNPFLNVREIKGRNPIRIIIDGKLSIPINSKVLISPDPEKTWIFTSHASDAKKIKLLEKLGVKIIIARGSAENQIKLVKVLKLLAENNITSVLVEGGQRIFSEFLDQNIFDEIIILQTPKILGSGLSSFKLKEIKNLSLKKVNRLEADILLNYGKNISD